MLFHEAGFIPAGTSRRCLTFSRAARIGLASRSGNLPPTPFLMCQQNWRSRRDEIYALFSFMIESVAMCRDILVERRNKMMVIATIRAECMAMFLSTRSSYSPPVARR
jgi:hypothetical protein